MIQTNPSFSNAAIGPHETVLQDIHHQAKNIAIFQRNLAPLQEMLKGLANETIECRASGTKNAVLSSLQEYFDAHLPDYPALFKDISNALGLFEQTTKASSFRLLLATVKTNMCRKFHTDVNTIRMLCTYIGQGTLWLPDEALDQVALRSIRKNHDIDPDKKHIQQVQTGDLVLLKGALYPDGNPIMHRSPSIEEYGEQRLLLRIDSNEFLNHFL
ncbi:MAG: DUF1826 domain-containing protein [Bacteroidota bacterium]